MTADLATADTTGDPAADPGGGLRRLAARERAPADRPDEATLWPSSPVQEPVTGDG